jgi:hypothetical protein
MSHTFPSLKDLSKFFEVNCITPSIFSDAAAAVSSAALANCIPKLAALPIILLLLFHERRIVAMRNDAKVMRRRNGKGFVFIVLSKIMECISSVLLLPTNECLCFRQSEEVEGNWLTMII